MRLNHLITIGLVTALSSIFGLVGISEANPVEGETSPPPSPELEFPPNKDDTFYRMFFHYGGDFYDQIRQGNQLNDLFGWNAFSGKWKALPMGAFPENQLMENGKVIDRIYHDVLYQQTSSDPLIRTRDIDNPFDSSLMDNPCYTRLSGQPCSVR